MKKIVIFFVLIITTGFGCTVGEGPRPLTAGYFIFGTYAGECFGNCFTGFKMESGKIFRDDLNYFYGNELSFENSPMDQDAYDRASLLLDSFPDFLKNNPGQKYGCPDCHDQGGIFLQLGEGANATSWHLDVINGALPPELIPYKERIQQVIAEIN